MLHGGKVGNGSGGPAVGSIGGRRDSLSLHTYRAVGLGGCEHVGGSVGSGKGKLTRSKVAAGEHNFSGVFAHTQRTVGKRLHVKARVHILHGKRIVLAGHGCNQPQGLRMLGGFVALRLHHSRRGRQGAGGRVDSQTVSRQGRQTAVEGVVGGFGGDVHGQGVEGSAEGRNEILELIVRVGHFIRQGNVCFHVGIHIIAILVIYLICITVGNVT